MGSAMQILQMQNVPVIDGEADSSEPLNVVRYYGSWPAPVGVAMRVQVGGDFTDVTVGIEESLDKLTWMTAFDVDGTLLDAITDSEIHALRPTHWIRLLVSPVQEIGVVKAPKGGVDLKLGGGGGDLGVPAPTNAITGFVLGPID